MGIFKRLINSYFKLVYTVIYDFITARIMRVDFGWSWLGLGGWCVSHYVGPGYIRDNGQITFSIGLLVVEAGITVSWPVSKKETNEKEARDP